MNRHRGKHDMKNKYAAEMLKYDKYFDRSFLKIVPSLVPPVTVSYLFNY